MKRRSFLKGLLGLIPLAAAPKLFAESEVEWIAHEPITRQLDDKWGYSETAHFEPTISDDSYTSVGTYTRVGDTVYYSAQIKIKKADLIGLP